jgi:hypothetical protein
MTMLLESLERSLEFLRKNGKEFLKVYLKFLGRKGRRAWWLVQ